MSNGLSLCKIHHAAFDLNMLGISPDYVVKVDAKLLEEVNGADAAPRAPGDARHLADGTRPTPGPA